MSENDQALHGRLLRREPRALDLLMELYLDPVYRLTELIIGQAGGQEDVEECVSDTFARAWQRAPEFDPARTSLRSWLLMLTKYTALDRRRQLMRQRFGPEGEPRVIPLQAAPEPAGAVTPDALLAREERRQCLREALVRLPEPDQILLTRRYFLEEPIASMARDLGLSRSALDNRLWRARRALKAALSGALEVQEIDDSVV